ncbi:MULTISPECIES: 4Fe-4S single cluster domain-containing protein [Rhodococcus]|uniref:4Fe-4S single cluster domain-containing protein n=1 Tax=Rhodococcus TaxID=1827 RepID=UPI000C9C00A8|nr:MULTISPECIES: 4Fe-4S single cluster domain-containing protein [Rhodococcus]PND53630.1 radical SAM protein [Rhodococcus sp. ENV425]WKW98907.1 4Fe-4S single cluster domain-containing protein [Rhodococcus aetherivorans]
MLRVGRILHGTTAEGPGRRTAVWVQGCSIRCPDCINPHLFTTRGGYDASCAEIVTGAAAAHCEGITLLGGEPFDQPSGCADLAEAAQGAGLGVIVFTGYVHEDLARRGEQERRLLAHIDCLVDGPYQAANPETRRALVGSTNQRFLHLTDRYRDYDPALAKNTVDVRINPDGTIEVAGFLEHSQLDALSTPLGKRPRQHRRL